MAVVQQKCVGGLGLQLFSHSILTTQSTLHTTLLACATLHGQHPRQLATSANPDVGSSAQASMPVNLHRMRFLGRTSANPAGANIFQHTECVRLLNCPYPCPECTCQLHRFIRAQLPHYLRNTSDSFNPTSSAIFLWYDFSQVT